MLTFTIHSDHQGAKKLAENFDDYQLQLIRQKQALIKQPQYEHKHDKVHHYNARPHVTEPVKPSFGTLKWEVVPNSLNSLDIAPSNYHLLQQMVHELSGQHFRSRSIQG